MTETTTFSVVVPVYNETEVIDAFYERMTAVARSLPFASYEIIFVDDGSTDDTWAKVRTYAESDSSVRPLKLSRNFGHQAAITAGLDHARGECIVIIDSDLQDPPEVVPEMVARWRDGYDVVYGMRSSRQGEGSMKLLTASAFYRLLNRLTRINIPVDVGDFRLLSRRAADQLRGLREQDRFVRGLVSWIGFRQTGVTYARDRRYAGDTKYPYRKMMKFALDGITSFSTVPLRLAMWLGYAASALAFIYLVSVFIQKLVLGITVQGWATTMVALLFLGGVQLICLGIMGEYVGRIFNEIKGRPLYVVEDFIDGRDGAAVGPDEVPARTAAQRPDRAWAERT